MSRLGAVLAALAAGLLAGTLAAAGDGEPDDYLVRAVFDNASFVIPGEDVKVGGVKVGTIDDVDLDRGNKAAVVLRIDDPAFRPFRRDAHCQIRLQSLIGEQYVECKPTEPRAADAEPAPPLERIRSGRGDGQYLLPVENTTTPVAVDLITNISRLPQRERLRLLIGELGAGLAGNGERLRAAVRRANPALRETQRVVAILAEQDRLLARLVDESDRVLEPLAARREQLGGFVDHAGATAVATAERGDDLERNLVLLPPFLRQLGPTADRFSALADEAIPALETLRTAAPAINESVERLGPFTTAATPALKTLGDTAEQGRRIFPAISPLISDLGGLGRELRPLSADLGALSTNFDDAGGIEELMRFIFFYTNAVNGEDELGHYIRSGFGVTGCSQRSSEPAFGCESTFDSSGAASAAGAGGIATLEYLLGPEDRP